MQQNEYKIEISEEAMRHTPEHALFFDIETTGLKKETAILSVLGCAYYEDEFLHIFQWINDDAVSEESILKAFINLLSKKDWVLISFNGDHYDLPFLKLHLDYNDLISPDLEEAASLDLYRFLRGFAPLLEMEKSTQKAWESYLGLPRLDQLEGSAIVKVYKNYLKTKNETELNLLLLHNLEDMKGLAHLMALMPFEQLLNGDFQIFGLMENEFKEHVALSFSLEFPFPLPYNFQIMTENGSYEMKNSRMGLVTIPYFEYKMYHFFENYKDYYYLPFEDRAIHKSVGAYVDQEHRIKANAKNCYIHKKNIFLPIPEKDHGYGFTIHNEEFCHLPIYKKEYHSKDTFLDFDDIFHENQVTKEAKGYVHNVLKSIFLEEIRKKIK